MIEQSGEQYRDEIYLQRTWEFMSPLKREISVGRDEIGSRNRVFALGRTWLVSCYAAIHLLRPSVNASADIIDIRKSLLAKILGRLLATSAVMAMEN